MNEGTKWPNGHHFEVKPRQSWSGQKESKRGEGDLVGEGPTHEGSNDFPYGAVRFIYSSSVAKENFNNNSFQLLLII